MKKFLPIVAIIIIASTVLLSCAKKSDEVAEKVGMEAGTDAVSAASIVDSASGFLQAISADGTWIIAVTQDISTDQNLVLDGSFSHRDELARKIALYDQDENHKVTKRYTLTAPRITVRSPNARIQGGTFVGDVYVEANDFLLIDATLDGNLYFASEEYKASFKHENGATITGETSVE